MPTVVRDIQVTQVQCIEAMHDDGGFRLLIGPEGWFEFYKAGIEYYEGGDAESGPRLCSDLGRWELIASGMGPSRIEDMIEQYESGYLDPESWCESCGGSKHEGPCHRFER